MRKFIYVLAALVAIAVIVLVAVQRQQLPKTLEGLYAEYHQRGHCWRSGPDVSNGHDSLGELHEREGNLESFYERRVANIDRMIADRSTAPSTP